MHWLNEPAEWSGDAASLTVEVQPDTDFWRHTHYGFVRDTGHFAWAGTLDGDGELRVRFAGAWRSQYDQAGLMLRVDAETWIKAGIELAEGREWLSVVVTHGRSDWSRQAAPAPATADGWWELRARRSGDAVAIERLGATGEAEEMRLAYMPADARVQAGVMCAAPDGPGFTARFADVAVSPAPSR
jgi:regulation of enolase protein 1 (concanavalin A-like superfamily)